MKRKLHTSVFLPVLLGMLAVSLPVRAAEEADLDQAREIILSAYTIENELSATGNPTTGGIEGNDVSLEGCNLTPEMLEQVFSGIYNSGALPWYAASSYGYTYEDESSLVLSFTPIYLDPAEYDRVTYEQKVAEILAFTVHEGMDPWQIALSIHDYLVCHFRYDETFTLYRGYDLLVEGTAVCSGYAEAYQDLLSRVGIESMIVESHGMENGHGWNLVKLHGQWYHVDVTWDDPTPDSQGYVSHAYFLLTDDELSAEGTQGHFGWESELHCTDTTYQDGFWRDTESAVTYTDAQTSYVQFWDPETYGSHIYARDEDSGALTLLYTDNAQFMDLGTGTQYNYSEFGLSLWNGRLYASNMDTVYSMAPDGSDLRTEFVYDAEGQERYIFGSLVKDGMIYLTLSDDAGNQTELDIPLAVGQENAHIHIYTAQVTPSTCTEQGFTTYTCTCGICCQENFILATGHSYDTGKVVLKPTLTDTGVKEFTCIHCGHTYTDSISILEGSAGSTTRMTSRLSGWVIGGIVLFLALGFLTKRNKL